MDSINKNQPEENFKNLLGEEGIKKLKEMVKQMSTCFFCTNIKTGKGFSTRPMSVQEIDEPGNLWFLSASDSHKNADLIADGTVQLLFQGSPHSDFLTVQGTAKIIKTKSIIKKLWKPLLKAWFTEGENDPRITAIKITPTEGYYWDTKHNKFIALIKTMTGAITGKTMDDSIEGAIKIKRKG